MSTHIDGTQESYAEIWTEMVQGHDNQALAFGTFTPPLPAATPLRLEAKP